MPKTFKLSFLEMNNETELSEKENEFLYRYFKYKNIDEKIQKMMKSLMNYLIRQSIG